MLASTAPSCRLAAAEKLRINDDKAGRQVSCKRARCSVGGSAVLGGRSGRRGATVLRRPRGRPLARNALLGKRPGHERARLWRRVRQRRRQLLQARDLVGVGEVAVEVDQLAAAQVQRMQQPYSVM